MYSFAAHLDRTCALCRYGFNLGEGTTPGDIVVVGTVRSIHRARAYLLDQISFVTATDLFPPRPLPRRHRLAFKLPACAVSSRLLEVCGVGVAL